MRKLYGFTISIYENEEEWKCRSFTLPIDKIIFERACTKYALLKRKKMVLEMFKALYPKGYFVVENFEKEI